MTDAIRTARRTISHRAARTERARRASQSSLECFARLIWPIVNPGRVLKWSWHMTALCEHLEAWLQGEVPRLIINLPPGHSKSFLVSVAAPTWAWLARPELRFICASYDMPLATKLNLQRRLVLDSPRYRSFLAPSWTKAAGEWGKTYFVNSERGFMRAVSTKTGVTGDHADLMIIDDPIKPEDIWGPQLRAHVEWLDETASTRFGDLGSACVCLVMQRIHSEDMTGVLLEREPERWAHLNLPAEYVAESKCSTAIGWSDPRTTDGELLCPERFPADVLDQMRVRMGTVRYSCQYQQDPIVGGGRMFNSDWWTEYDDLPDKIDSWCISIDAAFGERKGVRSDDDYNAVIVGARVGPRLYLVDCVCRRAEFNEFKTFLFGAIVNDGERHAGDGYAHRWRHVPTWLVEQAANGAAIVSELRRLIPRQCAVKSIKPSDSKQARAAVTAPLVESGHILVPRGAAWVPAFIEEAARFPNTAHNDRVDALTQLVDHYGEVLGIAAFRPEAPAPQTEAVATFRRWGGKGQAR